MTAAGEGRAVVAALAAALPRCWSAATSSRWTAAVPSRGQCGVTALAVDDLAGGEVLRTAVGDGRWHFYNRVDGERVDLTAAQFAEPPGYDDVPATRSEAFADTDADQYGALWTALAAAGFARAAPPPIATARLDLLPASVARLAAALDGGEALGRALGGVRVPASWPPPLLEPAKLRAQIGRAARDRAGSGWPYYFAVERAEGGGGPGLLVGMCGFRGAPSPGPLGREVEVGYTLVPEAWGRGLASEALGPVVARAEAVPGVRVIAQTAADNAASMRVLERAGFRRDEPTDPPFVRWIR